MNPGATIIESLAVAFGIETDTASFRAGIRQYTDFHNVVRDVTDAIKAFGSAMIAPVKTLLDTGNEAVLTAMRLGTSVQALQEMQAAAELTGVPVAALTQGMERLGRAAYMAGQAPMGAQAKAFQHLGIRVHDANGKLKDTKELLPGVIDKLSAIKNTAELDGVAFALLGRGAGQLLPLIRMGAGYMGAVAKEAHEAGVILSDETAQAARDATFWFRVLGMHAKGLEMQLGAGLLPIWYRVIGTLLAWKSANKGIIDQGMDHFVGRLSKGFDVLWKGIRSFTGAFETMIGYVGGWENAVDILLGALGVGFLAIVGAATAAMIRFAFSLALSSVGPLVLGAAIAALILVIQDLNSKDSILKDLWNNNLNYSQSPLISFLYTLTNAVKGLRDALEDLGKYTGMRFLLNELFDRSQLNQAERSIFLKKLQERGKDIGDLPQDALSKDAMLYDPSPGRKSFSNNITVNIGAGVQNPEAVKAAAKEGTQQGLGAGADALDSIWDWANTPLWGAQSRSGKQ